MNIDICTCHISELSCKHEKCCFLIKTRLMFKKNMAKEIYSFLYDLKNKGYERNASIRALRRELKHKNNYQFDIFDQVATEVWKSES